MLDKRGASIRAMFAEIAPRYDLANRLLSMRQDVGWRREVAASLLPRPGLVLDLAAGTGDLSSDLTRTGHAVVAGDFAWNDVGSWAAMDALWPRDDDGNAARGPVLQIDCRNTVTRAGDRLVAMVQDAARELPGKSRREIR